MENFLHTLDKVLQQHLQKNVSFSVNNKVVKSGKFILYNFYDYHIEFAIICKNKIKKTLIPIPFNIEHYKNENLIYFDYRIISLFSKLKPRNCESKYYNTILEISFQ